jgi:hypothetical protein
MDDHHQEKQNRNNNDIHNDYENQENNTILE